MTKQLRYSLTALFLLVATNLYAQEPKEDVSWLGDIPQPVLELDMMKASWDSANQSLLFTDIVVDWVDSSDADIKDHVIRKALNCMPVGNLESGTGDSVAAVHAGAKIDLQIDGGNIKVYSIRVPLRGANDMPITSPFNGTFTLMITAAKLVDSAYSVEHTISRRVTLENFENSP